MMQALKTCAAAIAVCAFFAIHTANAASYTAYDNAANITGLQNYGGALGLDFQVNSAITITALGAFNNGVTSNLNGKDGTSGINVGIFTLSGVAVGSSVHFTASSSITQLNGDAFLPVSFTLTPGSYSIVATNDVNYNSSGAVNTTSTTNDGGGLISFINTARYSPSTTFSLPATIDQGPANRYDAGSFQFVAASGSNSTTIPEPASALLLGAGLAGMALLRRKQASAASTGR
jgi:hypothetical protein